MKPLPLSICVITLCAFITIPTMTHAIENAESETTPETVQTENTTPSADQNSIGEESGEPYGNPEVTRERVLERAEFKTKVQSRIDMIRSNIDERRVRNRVRVEENARIRLEASLDMTINQFEVAIQKLTDLAERIEVRLTRMEERGFDTSASLRSLELARIEIEASAEAVATTAVSAVEALSSETPRARQLVVRTSLRDARTSLKTARESLVQAIASARPSLDTPIQKVNPPTEVRGE